jgi:F-type H+-transporting ATPase subunit gamma
MAQRFTQLHARTRSVSQLGDVVNAMRGIAAARAQQSRRQLQSVQAYADTVTQAISQVLAIAPDTLPASNGHGGNAGLLLFCAEHGFAGAFSEKIFEGARVERDDRAVLVVGSRGLRVAQARGLTPVWSAPMMAQLGNAALLADRIAAELYRCLHAGSISRVDVVYARPLRAQGFEVMRRSLLPLDYGVFEAAKDAVPPLLNLAPRALLERLAGEYLFAQLNEAIVQTYAAENAARLQTMTAARDNIVRRVELLTREERLARQEEITAEIIELAAGADVSRLAISR